jgi:hypothetical protein
MNLLLDVSSGVDSLEFTPEISVPERGWKVVLMHGTPSIATAENIVKIVKGG